MNQNSLGTGAQQSSRNLKLEGKNGQRCFGGFQNQKENVYENEKDTSVVMSVLEDFFFHSKSSMSQTSFLEAACATGYVF